MYRHPPQLVVLRKGLTYACDGRVGQWRGVRYVESAAIELHDVRTGEKFKAPTCHLRVFCPHATMEV